MSANEALSSRSIQNNDYESTKVLASSTESKLQDVGCCGDVPKLVKTKKRDKLLEWLKSSQLKREENNRQVFSRWIDMVDNGAIDLTSMTNFSNKTVKSLTGSTSTETTQNNDSLNCSSIPINKNISPIVSRSTPQNNCPYFPPVNNMNYYGINSNWFSANQAQTAVYCPYLMPQSNNGVYPNVGYCSNNQVIPNPQYVSVQQACTYCPPYTVPQQNASNNLDPNYLQHNLTSTTKPLNIEVNKWFDILNEIKINTPDKNINDTDFSLNVEDKDQI